MGLFAIKQSPHGTILPEVKKIDYLIKINDLLTYSPYTTPNTNNRFPRLSRMKPAQKRSIRLLNRCKSVCAQVLVWSMAVLFSFGQTPAMGAEAGDSGMGWIEICGGVGISFEQQSDDTKKEASLHCEYCLIQTSQPLAADPTTYSFPDMPEPISVVFVARQSVIVFRAEQFWAANRGPPLKDKEIYTMPTHSDEMIKSGMVELSAWGFPWV